MTTAERGAGVYAASALISENGYLRDSELFESYAHELSLGVLMANHSGPSGGWSCAGRSAFWTPGGQQVLGAACKGDCLVIARRRQGSGKVRCKSCRWTTDQAALNAFTRSSQTRSSRVCSISSPCCSIASRWLSISRTIWLSSLELPSS